MAATVKQEANGHEQDDDSHDEELLRAAAQADNQDHDPSSSSPQPSSAAATSTTDSTPMARSSSNRSRNAAHDVDASVHEERFNKLKFLLQRSGVYSRIMGEKMEKERKARAEAAAKQQARREAAAKADNTASDPQPSAAPARKTRSAANAADDKPSAPATSEREPRRKDTRKRKADESYDVSSYIDQDDLEAAKQQAEQANKKTKPDPSEPSSDSKANTANDSGRRNQPKLVTGATMREYQLDGLEWLISLYENGLNGILADEMGLGKTLQTISFLAHLREKGVWGPFLIVAPLSTINNWVLEFERFTPDIPALMYHGDPDARRDLRDRHLRMPRDKERQKDFPIVVTSYELIIRDRKWLANYPWKFIVVDEGHRLKNLNCRLIRELKTYRSANRLILSGTPLHNNLAELWSLLNFILPDIFDDLATFETWFDFSDIHDEQGQSRILSKENSSQVITQLHEILKPFLLRRLKADVETDLPPKKEYLLYAPLTELQKELYNSVVNGEIRRWLLERKTGLPWSQIQEILNDPDGINTASSSVPTTRVPSADQSRDQSPHPWAVANKKKDVHAKLNVDEADDKPVKRGPGRPRKSDSAKESAKTTRSSSADYHVDDDDDQTASGTSTPRHQSTRRAKRGVSYQVDEMSDNHYFDKLERELNRGPKQLSAAQAERQGKLFSIREAQKQIKSMHLENIVIQARKICNHPFLFDWPVDMDSGTLVVNKDLINASGKMLMLNRLLDELFNRGHKVLIFSQFTTMLDIIEEWANEFKGLRTCRIDGTTPQEGRRAQMKSFNEDKGADACNLFLLSTRAGGLGINLVAADTVIFYDSDWNPQMDLQAQDRVHRIGQTRPCLIFRLVSASTVEERILKRAGNKRKLEALVIQQGKFRLPAGYQPSLTGGKRKKEDELSDIASQLLALESEQVKLVKDENDQIITDHELDLLLDRSKEAYERKMGWVSNAHADDPKKPGRKSAAGRSAFEVTETKTDEANEEIAKLLAGN
ncbi:related to proliferation associated SNF2-like protein [Sporisorium reilianum f. sp. reilianum]|uniref:Related to proliferation associated SNF2-like protein n=1 Tax=Sporisorium reilianum f. sp. reilianum TaxID=72559 RepID=A0A2N8UIT7_9BASI|nr:related to proliferation associated SNF2-like protein [Sporisorium reilianum f. sp. reilianum]